MRPIAALGYSAHLGVVLGTQSMQRSVEYLTLSPSDPSVLVILHSPFPILLLFGLCDLETPSELHGFVLAVSNISFQLLREKTVGGTSWAALRPGFFRGGRTQVLLKAPFEITSLRVSSRVGEGEFEGSTYAGRGARGVASGGLMLDSGEAKPGT